MRILFNQFLNIIWTFLGFACILLYWLSIPLYPWFYLFIILSVLCLLLNSAVYRLSRDLKFYEQIGVKVIKKFVQDGDLVNNISPGGNRKVGTKKEYLTRYLSSINMYEKYHILCFVFFSSTAIHALVDGNILMALAIIISNIFYNFYPVALQQYNRAKILRIFKS